MILVQLREQGRDLALAEAIVQRVVDILCRNAETRSGRAVIAQGRLASLGLLIASDVGELRQLLESREEFRHITAEFLRARILQTVLVLRAADDILDRDVLHRLHVETDAVDRIDGRLQVANHVRCAFAVGQWFEIDLNAAAIERRVGAVDADERG